MFSLNWLWREMSYSRTLARGPGLGIVSVNHKVRLIRKLYNRGNAWTEHFQLRKSYHGLLIYLTFSHFYHHHHLVSPRNLENACRVCSWSSEPCGLRLQKHTDHVWNFKFSIFEIPADIITPKSETWRTRPTQIPQLDASLLMQYGMHASTLGSSTVWATHSTVEF